MLLHYPRCMSSCSRSTCPVPHWLLLIFFCLVLVSKADLTRLQHVKNKAAKLVFACGQDRCSVDLLYSLHWLQSKDQICFKMMLYVYKYIMNVAPHYLCDLITLFSNTWTFENRPGLHSSSDTILRSWFHVPEKELVIIPLLLPLRGSGMSYQFSRGVGVCACFQTVDGNAFVRQYLLFVVYIFG